MTLYHYPLSENGIENPFFFTKYFSLIFPSTNIRITNDSREDEMEQNMQGVGNILGNLKNMATDMGDEIERQNKHLDLIQGKVTSYRANIYGFYFKNYYLLSDFTIQKSIQIVCRCYGKMLYSFRLTGRILE